MVHAEDDVEARRRAIVAVADRRIQLPANLCLLLGCLGGALDVGMAISASLAGNTVLFIVWIFGFVPAALLAAGGLQLRRLDGWNPVWAGLLLTVFHAVFTAGAVAFFGWPMWWLSLAASAPAPVLILWMARLEEDQEIRMARNLRYPPKPRDPVDYQVL